MSANAGNNNSCQWTSATAIVESVQKQGLNVAEVVARCGNVCPLIFAFDEQTGVRIHTCIVENATLTNRQSITGPGVRSIGY